MQTVYNDYSNHLGLRICHQLGRLRTLPIKGINKITQLLTRIVPKPTPKGPCIIKTIHGFKLIVDPAYDKGLERTLSIYGTYEEGTLRIMSQVLREKSTFIDIGANIGLMSLHAAQILKKTGRVLSFEALPSTYDILQQNIKLNKFENIEAINMALGSTSGTIDIFDNDEINRGSSSLIKSEHSNSSHQTSIMPFDEFLDKHPEINNISSIKIDVEGWELEVLKGAKQLLSNPEAPVCIVECSTLHPTYGGSTQDIYHFLRTINSYRIFHLANGKERTSKLVEIVSTENLPEHDNLFCFLPGHIQSLPQRLFVMQGG